MCAAKPPVRKVLVQGGSQQAAAVGECGCGPPCGGGSQAAQPGCVGQQVTGREERLTLLKEQQAYEREVLRADNEQRTREFVDSMWQSLE